MPYLGTITLVGILVLAGLVALLMKYRAQDHLDAHLARRKGTAKYCCKADYLEGMQKIPVALSLSEDTLFYENDDLQASLDLARIEEIEYDDETMTGHDIPNGKALRLRSHGHTFEFLMDHASIQKWQAMLPAHSYSENESAHAV